MFPGQLLRPCDGLLQGAYLHQRNGRFFLPHFLRRALCQRDCVGNLLSPGGKVVVGGLALYQLFLPFQQTAQLCHACGDLRLCRKHGVCGCDKPYLRGLCGLFSGFLARERGELAVEPHNPARRLKLRVELDLEAVHGCRLFPRRRLVVFPALLLVLELCVQLRAVRQSCGDGVHLVHQGADCAVCLCGLVRRQLLHAPVNPQPQNAAEDIHAGLFVRLEE